MPDDLSAILKTVPITYLPPYPADEMKKPWYEGWIPPGFFFNHLPHPARRAMLLLRQREHSGLVSVIDKGDQWLIVELQNKHTYLLHKERGWVFREDDPLKQILIMGVDC